MTSIFWFRRDARLDDNPGLNAALADGPVLPIFVIDPGLFDRCSPRRRQLLLAGLNDLDQRLKTYGGRFLVERGDPVEVVPRVARHHAAQVVHVSGEITPYGVRRDREVATHVDLKIHDGVYAHPPGSVLTTAGKTYRVFSPFYRSWSERPIRPVNLPDGADFIDIPRIRLTRVEDPVLPAGPGAAEDRLRSFLERADHYDDQRDRIDLDATSHASLDLKYGWIGPRRLIAEVGCDTAARVAFVRQVAWRDFYGHLLAEHPSMVDSSFEERYHSLGWRDNPDEIAAWKEGRTGFPIVDAAMRRLVAEGQMHNRARLIVGSFLVKDLMVDWRVGERFFRHHLVDGEIAQNTGSWQWVAGTGTDAAPLLPRLQPGDTVAAFRSRRPLHPTLGARARQSA